ncbi:MAG: XisI protein, partial [Bacteroidetes bacterium]|nr:XisI protein [Bacteroidota bacterium]
MDTLNKTLIVSDLVKEIGNMVPSDEFTETQIILDKEGGHFLLFDIGWHGKKRVYLPFVHVDVMLNGKVWIQHDGTDLNIAGLLIEKGIPQNDIVIGFRAPHVRAMMEGF